MRIPKSHPATATEAKALIDSLTADGVLDFSCSAETMITRSQSASSASGNAASSINLLETRLFGAGPSGLVPTLQTLVATVNLNTRLDLKIIATHARNTEYNSKRFGAVVMRIRDPKCTALIFGSGKMVVTGAKSEDDARLAARKFARIIQKLGFNAKFTEFKIQNVVGSCDLKFHIRLEGLAARTPAFSSYEPEIFPGLTFRMVNPKVVLLIFISGKVVLTGAKDRVTLYQAFENIWPLLKDFEKVY